MNLNLICANCGHNDSVWICTCANTGICEDCVPIHRQKPLIHLLVDKNQFSGIEKLFQPITDAVKATQFIDEEITWVRQCEQDLGAYIEKYTEWLKEEVDRIKTVKKDELHDVTEQTVRKLEQMKSCCQKADILQVKAEQKHFFAISTHPVSVSLQDCLPIAVEQCVTLRESSQVNPKPSQPLVEKQFQLGKLKSSSSWEGRDARIDAITLQFSKSIILIGISVGKQREPSQPATLELLQVIHGNSTRGSVMSSHTRIYPLESSFPDRVSVRFTEPVFLSLQTAYTFKARLRGKVFSTGPILSKRVQDSLEVTYERPSFAGGDEDNGSNEASGVFFELLYSLP